VTPEEIDTPDAGDEDASSEAPAAKDEASAVDETAASASDEASASPAEPASDVTPEPVAAAEEPAEAPPEVEAEAPDAVDADVSAEAPAEEPEAPVADETAASASDETPAPPVAAEEEAATDSVAAEVPAAEEAPAEAPVAAAPEVEAEEVEIAPRAKPEIPGADLIPDIVTESEEFLDAEAQAAAEAEAEAAAAAEADAEVEAQPIADAAIDLAAGARYTATGKRKTAVARVILKPGSGSYAINGRTLEQMFPRDTLQRVIRQPLEAVGYEARMDVVARMHGGGVAAQAGALRHGISRALLEADPNLRGELKRRGFLTRDPRVKERKKAGLKKARKRPQFSKR
jgi:small subunit ribosomal protein S9